MDEVSGTQHAPKIRVGNQAHGSMSGHEGERPSKVNHFRYLQEFHHFDILSIGVETLTLSRLPRFEFERSHGRAETGVVAGSGSASISRWSGCALRRVLALWRDRRSFGSIDFFADAGLIAAAGFAQPLWPSQYSAKRGHQVRAGYDPRKIALLGGRHPRLLLVEHGDDGLIAGVESGRVESRCKGDCDDLGDGGGWTDRIPASSTELGDGEVR